MPASALSALYSDPFGPAGLADLQPSLRVTPESANDAVPHKAVAAHGAVEEPLWCIR